MSTVTNKKLVFKRLPEAKVMRAAEKDNGTGFCMVCGTKFDGYAEPDAEKYPCSRKSCGAPAVYGAMAIIERGWTSGGY